MLPHSDTIAYVHLTLAPNKIHVSCNYHHFSSEYTLEQDNFLYDSALKCHDYFEHICKHLLRNHQHPLHKSYYKRDDQLPYAKAVVITCSPDTPKYCDPVCARLKESFHSVLHKFLHIFQLYFCEKHAPVYFHTNFCRHHHCYLNARVLYDLYEDFSDCICPIPLNLSLRDSLTCEELKEFAHKFQKPDHYEIQDIHERKACYEAAPAPSYVHCEHDCNTGYEACPEENPKQNKGGDTDPHQCRKDCYEPKAEDPCKAKCDEGYEAESDKTEACEGEGHQTESCEGESQEAEGCESEAQKTEECCDDSDNHHENESTCCNVYEIPPKSRPVLTLGKCFNWDSFKCEDGTYKIDLSQTGRDSKSPRLNAAARFVFNKDGIIAWRSDCHGVTTVCMETADQLIDALNDPLQVKLLIDGRNCSEG
ncbi:MAG: hypothetical protein H6850_00405 [Alphaproteobacteria bacterium]|nr:MAG: hypothetical protein H6850_00405 [Alphaproteobacteria bacterium]